MSMISNSDKRGGEMYDSNVDCCTGHDQSREERRMPRILISLNLIAAIALLAWVHLADGCRKIPVPAYGEKDGSEGRLTAQIFRRELQMTSLPVTQDHQALLSLKTRLQVANPASSPLLGSWAHNVTNPCLWSGITCNLVGGVTRVTTVDLSNKTLGGLIPLELTNLTALVSLFLQMNSFTGTIPPEIGTLSYLTSLDLSNNKLSGPIPISFGGLTKLQFLNLEHNNLTGGIPPELLSICGDLKRLNISSNADLGGQLPAGWKNCQNLTHLDLMITAMAGTILLELGELPGLQHLNLGENHFTGAIPTALFANCGELNFLDLSLNQLVGAIPAEVGNCSKLTVAMFSQNNLTSIPLEIGRLTSLNWLFLGQNNFVGEVPSQLSILTNLTILDLKANLFSGSIPPFLSQLKSLQYLFLQRNMFTGSIPPEFSALSNLIYFDLSDNLLTGPIPSSLGSLSTTMKFLFLASNFFTSIPAELGNLINLQLLEIGDNQLTGSIPGSIFNLPKLIWLRLANNRLSGPIPNEISNSTSLMWLNLFNNSLSGPFPQNLASISSTAPQTFQINIDSLLYLPKQLGDKDTVVRWLPRHGFPYSAVSGILTRDNSQTFWNYLMRGTNQNPSCLYVEIFSGNGYIQVSNNHLSGRLPPSLGEIPNVISFHMSNNNFTGAIPPVFTTKGMTFLELDNNSLTGPIPDNLDQMKCALIIQLDHNNLSGRIPTTLQLCQQLTIFNVSYNPQLSGPVPTQNQFATFSSSSYLGDDLLCSPLSRDNESASNTLPFCKVPNQLPPGTYAPSQNTPKKESKLTTSTIVGVVLASVLGALVFGLAGFCLIGRPAPVKTESNELSDDDGKDSQRFADSTVHLSLFSVELPKQLTYTDLLMATNNFDEGNVVGSGGFGVVYRAKLMDGSLVAIKKLIQEGPKADREFLAEMETLGHVHHDNLVPLLGCSTFGSEKLLVYRFMANGSLDDWLHERPNGAQMLGWPLRLNIALGMAKGLKFLHHNCSPPIIHRDMKASNILLDENFEPRLTDFGLARVLGAQETHVSTIVAGTLGYVPPEYCQTWRATIKGDVYSLGVVLLELITGRRPMDAAYNDKNCGNIVEWVIALIKEGSQKAAYDPIVASSGSPIELLQFLKLATWCTEDLPIKRPTMREVLKALEVIKSGNYAKSEAERKS